MSLGSTEPLLRLSLPCGDSAPAELREALRGLDGLGWMLGDAMLVGSEMVTDMVLHWGCERGEPLEVALERDAEHLRISVQAAEPAATDGAGASGAAAGDPFRRLGLRVVRQMTVRCGAERSGRRRLWADLALPSAEGPDPVG